MNQASIMTSEQINPVVSIIIPYYNGREYIREALLSSLQQSGVPTEVIVIDDGSPEPIDDLLSEFGNSIVLLKKDNGGCASARNFGIRQAKGEYIALLDADDKCIENRISHQIKFMQSNPDAVACHGNIVIIDDHGHQQSHNFFGHDPLHPPVSGDVFEELFKGNFVHASTVVFRKKSAIAVGGFDESLRYAEDYHFWMKLANIGEIHYINEFLSEYRWHQNNISKNSKRMAEARLIARLKILISANSTPTSLSSKAMSTIIARRASQEAYKYYKNSEPDVARALLKIGLRAKPFDLLLIKMFFVSYFH